MRHIVAGHQSFIEAVEYSLENSFESNSCWSGFTDDAKNLLDIISKIFMGNNCMFKEQFKLCGVEEFYEESYY